LLEGFSYGRGGHISLGCKRGAHSPNVAPTRSGRRRTFNPMGLLRAPYAQANTAIPYILRIDTMM
jgi:hypothetical protein